MSGRTTRWQHSTTSLVARADWPAATPVTVACSAVRALAGAAATTSVAAAPAGGLGRCARLGGGGGDALGRGGAALAAEQRRGGGAGGALPDGRVQPQQPVPRQFVVGVVREPQGGQQVPHVGGVRELDAAV